MSVGRICVRDVDVALRDESVRVVADRMNARNVGTLVVLDQDRSPLGIVTDRDLTVRVLAKGLDPILTSVEQVMTRVPQSIHENAPIEEALQRMRAGKFRRLPVVNNAGVLVGLIAIDDVLDLVAEELEDIRGVLHEESPDSFTHV